jgi:hypothetical protein
VFGTFRCQSCGESAKRLAALMGYARTEARGSCKCLFLQHVAVMALQFTWQTGCTTTAAGTKGSAPRHVMEIASSILERGLFERLRDR